MIDPRERLDDPEEAFRVAFEGLMRGTWTGLPAIVEEVTRGGETVTLQPTIKGFVTDPLGNTIAQAMPLLPDVPVLYPSGGGVTITFPIKPGDECFVAFANRAIDVWFQLGGVQLPNESRTFDLSDGFAFFGPRSTPRHLQGISTTALQIRNNAGTAFLEFDPAAGSARFLLPGGLTIVGDITHDGTQTTSGDVIASGISLNSHTHGGVKAGPDSTGGPQ